VSRDGWRRVWKRFLPSSIGLGIIVLLVVWANPVSIYGLLSQIVWRFLILGLLFYMVAVLVRSQKLHLYLNLLGSVGRLSSLAYYVMGTFLSVIIPGRMGEPVVSILIRREQDIAVSSLLPVLIADRLMDFAVILSYATFSLLWVGPGLSVVFPHINVWPLVVLGSATSLVFWLGMRRRVLKYHSLQKIINNSKLSFRLLRQRPRVLAASVLLTLLSWPFEIGAMFWTIQAFGVALSYFQVMSMFCLGTLAGVISMIPGGTGAAEGSMAGLALLWKVEKERIISALLVNKVLLTACISLLALVFFYATKTERKGNSRLELP